MARTVARVVTAIATTQVPLIDAAGQTPDVGGKFHHVAGYAAGDGADGGAGDGGAAANAGGSGAGADAAAESRRC